MQSKTELYLEHTPDLTHFFLFFHPMQQQSKWHLILNPVAGNGKGQKTWPKIQQLLQQAGIAYEASITTHAGHAIELARKAVQAGYQKIIAAGGDGTANEVINGMFDQTQVATQTLTFAIIPVGSGNDWIKTHAIPNNYKKAIRLIAQGKTQSHDVGKVFYYDTTGKRQYRYFINVAGLAYDAFVTKATQVRPKWGSNNSFYYLYLIFSCITRFKPSPMKVLFDGQEMEHAFFNVTIGQCKYNGGGTQLAPHAVPNDGLFALTLLKDIKAWEVVVKAPQFYSGTVVNHSEAFSTQVQKVRIEAPSKQPAFVEVDGEYLGQTPIDFEMFREAFSVIVP